MPAADRPFFDHVGLAVADVAASAGVWAILLGAEPTPLPGGGQRFQLDRGALELSPASRGGGPGRSLGLCLDGAAAAGETLDDPGGLAVRWRPVIGAAVLAPPAPTPFGKPDAAVVDTPVSPDRVHAIDHVVIRTNAPDRAIALWRDRLGLRLALDREFPRRGLRMLFFRSAGVTLEFVAPIAPTGTAGQDAIDGIAWQVADIAACRARLVASGLDVSEIRDGHKRGTRVATVRSAPDGLPTLLIEQAARVEG